MASKGRRAQAEATRQHIIDSAWRVMGRKGCAALTTNALLREAGVSRGSLYHHFPGIDNVVEIVLTEKMTEAFSEVDVTACETLDEWFDAFEAFQFQGLLADTDISRALYSFIPMGMFDERFRPLLAVMLREGFAAMGRAVAYFHGDKFSEQQQLAVGRMIDAYSTGLGVQWHTFGDADQCYADWQQFRRMLQTFIQQLASSGGN